MQLSKNLSLYFHEKVLLACLFGFCSGISLLVTGNTINFWLAQNEISKLTIGLFSIASLPYAFKYLFGPIVDNFYLFFKKIGRTKSWVIFSQIGIVLSLIIISFLKPGSDIVFIFIMNFVTAIFAVLQDVALDSYRVKLLGRDIISHGSSIYVFGYRLGMLIAGAGAIYLSSFLAWEIIFKLLALLVLMFLIIIYFSNFPLDEESKIPIKLNSLWDKIKHYFFSPFSHIKTTREFFIIILFFMFYRASDNMIYTMNNPFLLYLNFTAEEIATAGKIFGFIASLLGGVLSGAIIPFIGIYPAIISFGLIHSLSHLLYILQYITGKNIYLLYLLTGAEAITGGMTMACYIYLMTSLCKGDKTATQYALFCSIMGLSRVVFGSSSGYLVDNVQWYSFFIITILIGLTSIIPAIYLAKSKP